MNWTENQTAIFSEVASAPSQSLMVDAVAGSGKTTTLLEAQSRVMEPKLLLAFNKRIADEMNARGANAATFNSHGFSQCRDRKIFKTNPKKLFGIMEKAGINAFSVKNNTRAIVSYAKNQALFSVDPDIFLEEVIPFVDFDEEGLSYEGYAELAAKVFEESVSDLSCVDFDDQVFFPLYHKWYLEPVHTVFTDESQDLNLLQHEYLSRIAGDRIVSFGDPSQAIYAFRGAHETSMSVLADRFNAKWMPLTCTFRCPKRVTALAKRIKPEIYCPDTAIEGKIFEMGPETLSKELGLYNSNFLILCRNNAPLFRYALECLQRNIPFRFQGNFAQTMIGMIYKFQSKSKSHAGMKIECNKWLELERRRWARYPHRVRLAADKAECFNLLVDASTSAADMKRIVAQIGEGSRGLCLSTVHQAKGLEAKDVVLLEPSLIGEEDQEPNIRYVAVTRAKETLTFVENHYHERKEV